MQLRAITFIFACAMITGAVASLVARNSTEISIPNATPILDELFIANEYIELSREMTSTGNHLGYYGLGPVNATVGTQTIRSEAAKVEERGRSQPTCTNIPKPSCSTCHSARNEVCESLVSELGGDYHIQVGWLITAPDLL